MLKSSAIVLGIASLLAAVTLFLPPHAPQYLYTSASPVTRLEWDTGYGLNNWQSLTEPNAASTDKIGGRQFHLLHRFGRFALLKKVKLCSPGPAEVVLKVGEMAHHLMGAPPDSQSCREFAVPKGITSGAGRNWFYLGLGSLLLALLLFHWGNFLSQPWRRPRSPESGFWAALGILALVGTAVAATLSFPGHPNPFEPIYIFEGDLTTGYSAITAWLWLSLAELAPRGAHVQFFVSVVQMAAFGLVVLAFLRLANPPIKPGARLLAGAAILAFLLNPLQLNAHFSISRSHLAGYLNFFFWLNSFVLLHLGNRAPPRAIYSLLAIAIFSSLVRYDIIPFVFLVTVILGLRLQTRRPLLLLTGPISLIVALIVNAAAAPWGPLEKEFNYAYSQTTYLMERATDDGPVPPSCRRIERIINADAFKARIQCFLDRPSVHLAALVEFLQEAVYGDLFLHFVVTWDEPKRVQLMMDAHLIDPPDMITKPGPVPSNGRLRPAMILIPLLLMALAAFLRRRSPATALMSALMLLRFLFLVAFSPSSNFHYFYEVFLWGWFVAIGLAIEAGILGRDRPA